MKRCIYLTAAAMAACGPPANSNPPVLWLAPDQNETHVKLVANAPDPV
jgi:hypothetical protein